MHMWMRKKYDDSDSSEKNEPVYLTLAVVGDATVGKTTLLYRVITGRYKGERYETVGCEQETLSVFSNHPHYDRETQLELVDTAGTERYGAFVKQTLHHVDGVLLVFNALDRGSFQSVVEKWNELVDSVNPYCVKTLVATHADVYAEQSAEKRWMDSVDMRARAKMMGCRGGFHAVSSRSGAHVEALFVETVDLVISYKQWLEKCADKEQSGGGVINIRASSRKEYHKTCVC